jgi:hypothetical protein
MVPDRIWPNDVEAHWNEVEGFILILRWCETHAAKPEQYGIGVA